MRLLFLFSLLFAHSVLGQSVLAPFREGQSNYVTSKQKKAAQKQFKETSEVLIKSIGEGLSAIDSEVTFDNVTSVIQRSLETLPGKKIDLRYKYEHVLVLMRANDLIDDVLYRLLKDHFEQYYFQESYDDTTQLPPSGPAMTIKNYLVKKEAVKRNYLKLAKYKDEVVTSEDLSPFPIKQFKMKAGGHSGLSARERLYYLYSPAQIREMALIMDLALSIADAKSVVTTIEFRNGSSPMVINHSPTEQYRLSLRIMRTQKEEAESDQARLGTYVNDLDLIVAAYELGILSYEEVSLIANNKDFYLPEVSFAKKVVSYLGSLASIAVRVHPATAPYAIIPMMLYNSYAEVKKAQSKIDEDSFIFSLPKR